MPRHHFVWVENGADDSLEVFQENDVWVARVGRKDAPLLLSQEDLPQVAIFVLSDSGKQRYVGHMRENLASLLDDRLRRLEWWDEMILFGHSAGTLSRAKTVYLERKISTILLKLGFQLTSEAPPSTNIDRRQKAAAESLWATANGLLLGTASGSLERGAPLAPVTREDGVKQAKQKEREKEPRFVLRDSQGRELYGITRRMAFVRWMRELVKIPGARDIFMAQARDQRIATPLRTQEVPKDDRRYHTNFLAEGLWVYGTYTPERFDFHVDRVAELFQMEASLEPLAPPKSASGERDEESFDDLYGDPQALEHPSSLAPTFSDAEEPPAPEAHEDDAPQDEEGDYILQEEQDAVLEDDEEEVFHYDELSEEDIPLNDGSEGVQDEDPLRYLEELDEKIELMEREASATESQGLPQMPEDEEEIPGERDEAVIFREPQEAAADSSENIPEVMRKLREDTHLPPLDLPEVKPSDGEAKPKRRRKGLPQGDDISRILSQR